MGCTTVKSSAAPATLWHLQFRLPLVLVVGKHLITFLDTDLMFWSPRSSSQFWIVLLAGWDISGWSPRQGIWLPELLARLRPEGTVAQERQGRGPAWALSPSLASVSCSYRIQRLGPGLNCEPPGSGRPDPTGSYCLITKPGSCVVFLIRGRL